MVIVCLGLVATIEGRALAVVCNDDTGNHLPAGSSTTDLQVTGPCEVKAGTYTFHNVDIFSRPTQNSRGTLSFDDAKIDFYAESIVIENRGSLIAGSPTQPIGKNGGVVTIHLWGAKNDAGIICTKDNCDVPDDIWSTNPAPPMMNPPLNPATCTLPPRRLPGGVNDCFYAYDTLDDSDKNKPAYFGHKVLALSYGGTLQMFGKKGATYSGSEISACKEDDPSCSGTSWVRLNAVLSPGDQELKVDGAVDWQQNDHIVVTTTDYLPSHSEELIISKPPTFASGVTTIDFTNADGGGGAKWPHNGQQYDFAEVVPARLGLSQTKAETRAAVALLSRSIRIVSQGDEPTDAFTEAPGNYYGGHTIVRQGFLSYQVQGVEFFQLGQGGAIMHYPVHFHMARQTPITPGPLTPPPTFVKDSSIHDSMTRWITLHATQGVRLARNVGYLSIGHGFYLEDATETNNQLFSNIGIMARAAVDNAQNPRKVPGILTAKTPIEEDPNGNTLGFDNFPYYSDSNNPAVFWITNGWNDFQYNMAAGAATCGSCYWFVPAAISGMSLTEKWFGYASEQDGVGRAGISPLKTFIGNSCSSAMNAFTVNSTTTACNGVNQVNPAGYQPNSVLSMIPSEGAQKAYFYNNKKQLVVDPLYWPTVSGGGRLATRCKAADQGKVFEPDCSTVAKCSNGNEKNCDVTVIDKFTTGFNWAQQNFAAVWMRPFWSLVINSVIHDVQNGGVNFVTSGDFSKSSVINGFWAVARKNVFIGSTQTDNPLASNAGAFNPFVSANYSGPDGNGKLTGFKCGVDPVSGNYNPSYCLSHDDGVAVQLSNFSVSQRFFSVYDGPAYQDSNAYLNIHPVYLTSDGTATGGVITGCQPSTLNGNPCVNSGFMNGGQPGILADQINQRCFLPNAGIGWKQPNGFYYAPAFHSLNLFFDSVDIRHFVTEPLFLLGTFDTDVEALKKQYCYWGALPQPGTFTGFTDIDRETVLNDDDGTLTGLTASVPTTIATAAPTTTAAVGETISVNKEDFFDAPIETPECASDAPLNPGMDAKCAPNTAKTSPYEYITASIFPECALQVPETKAPLRLCADGNWGNACTTSDPTQVNSCVGVPLYRQYLISGETPGLKQQKRMMGQSTFQRSGLTVNHGNYYIDTTVSKATQMNEGAKSVNVFTGGQKYDLFFLYAKGTTKQTYSLWVGNNFNVAKNLNFGYVNIDTAQYDFKQSGTGKLPAGWTAPPPVNGILTITVDMTSLAKEFDLTQPKANPLGDSLCQPATMCDWNKTSNKCECNITDTRNYLYDDCHEKNAAGDDAICSWSVKDLDCPAKGCPAIQITFPNGFKPDDATDHHRPATAQFSSDPNFAKNWNIPFELQKSDIAGQRCTYAQYPPSCQ